MNQAAASSRLTDKPVVEESNQTAKFVLCHTMQNDWIRVKLPFNILIWRRRTSEETTKELRVSRQEIPMNSEETALHLE